ncbi:SDR family NAD(P)-dependent oxidoreductase [Amycolatopsis sp. cg5]|uniref:SDR family NAD(P)-dependent oxidoreductase n=1 Tax=Amycolatopsis sp. cg5 TaxID=3238802 RepID=UPI00352574F6
MADKPFDARTVVVTGGGTGIGRATALAFAALGARRVLITGRRADRLAEVAALDAAITPVTADVTTERGAGEVAEAVREHGGTLDVLVHNAGVFRHTPVDGLESAKAREVLETNVLGPITLTSRLAPLLRSPGGSVVLVSSMAAGKPVPGAGVYAASKAAVDCLTRAWALELAPRGIRVNAVAPSSVRTEVWAAGGFSPKQIDAIFAAEAAKTPLGVNCRTEDVTPWITRFAEDSSAFVTGQVLTVGGGADLT